MAAPTMELAHGGWDSVMLLPGWNVRQTSNGLDTGTARFVSGTNFPFTRGQVLTQLPGTLYVAEVDNIDRGIDKYEHVVSVEGLLTNPKKIISAFQRTISIDDWDTVSETVLTSDRNYFRKGQLGNYGGTTVCTSAPSTPLNVTETLWRVTGNFKGIIETKIRTRSVTSNGQVINGDSIRAALENGWTNYRKGQVSLPKITVTDTYPSLTPPDTQSVPSRRTPPSPPGIRNLDGLTFRTVDESNLGATASRDVWPSQWSYTCGYGQPFGINIPLYMVTETFEWNWPVIPA